MNSSLSNSISSTLHNPKNNDIYVDKRVGRIGGQRNYSSNNDQAFYRDLSLNNSD